MPTKTELTERAYAAWLKFRRGRGSPPTLSASTVEVYDDKTYVFLRRGTEIVDVYRYKENEDHLVRLVRYWPGPYGRQRVAA